MPQPSRKKSAAWSPAEYEIADLNAVRAVAAGEANSIQQQRAIRWLVENVCGTYQLSYRPESDRDTAFAEGRRFVGLQIVKAINLRTDLLTKRSET